MPSIISAAAGLMALSGLATAFPQGGFSNTTVGAVSGNSTAVNSTTGASNSTMDPLTEALYCPTFDGSVLLSRASREYILDCATNHMGVVIEVVANSTLFRRQAGLAPANIQDCTSACDAVAGCVGTSFNTAARTCTLFSEVGVAYADADSDFAVLIADAAPTTATAGQTLTSTVYSTNVVTISSCAPTVTNCPVNAAGAVTVTQVVAVSTTEYICPAATVIPASPVACSCAFSASTTTVYSSTVVGGSTSLVAVSTAVVAVPSPSMTGVSTTTIATTGALPTTAGAAGAAGAATTSAAGSSGSATTTGGLASFTGAASNVKAGMGLIVGVAGLAFML